MNYKINENCLCVLRLANQHDKGSKLIIEFEPLCLNDPWDIGKYIDSLLSKAFFNGEDVLELTNQLIKASIPEYSNILVKNESDIDLTFCKFLSVAYQEIEFRFDYNILKKDVWKESIGKLDYIDEFIQSGIKNIIKTIGGDLDYMAKIIALAATYKQCENNNDIKFYSHRKLGWASPIVELNNSLSVKIDTNFGYGKSSYFYIKLIYRGIDIIPFIDLVSYRHVGIGEIKSYSKKYTPDNDNWYCAMEYVRDAYNLLIENEFRFVQKFIVDEIENLVNKLKTVMVKDAFYFIDMKHKLDQVTKIPIKNKFTGIELLKLRGEKLTQSLAIIPTIEEFRDFTEIDSSISEIKQLNQDFLPILTTEIDDLAVKISDADTVLKEIESILEDYQKKHTVFKQLRDELEKELIINRKIPNSDLHQKTLERLFSEKYPEYDELNKTYSDTKQKFYIKKADVNKMKTNKNLLSDYCEKIKKVLPQNNLEYTK